MNIRIKFSKMQGTGNDFVMIDARDMIEDWKNLAKVMCRNHFGIGADGIIIVQNSTKADLKMRIFNADGSEAQICGNGLRCFAKFSIERKIVKGPDFYVETLAGIKLVQSTISDGKVSQVKVNMGQPNFKPANIPVSLSEKHDRDQISDYPLNILGSDYKLSFVSMGNPHAVCFLGQDVYDFALSEIGPLIENHPIFPQRTNFEIVNKIDGTHLKARVWERGVGETLACGSGACAIAVVSHLKKLINETVDIILSGGILTISWNGSGDVFLKGPVEEVYTGEYLL